MAVLTEQEKRDIASKWVHDIYRAGGKTATMHRGDLISAVQDTEDWIASNQASYVAALGTPFSSEASGAEKTLLFCYTAMKRAGLI